MIFLGDVMRAIYLFTLTLALTVSTTSCTSEKAKELTDKVVSSIVNNDKSALEDLVLSRTGTDLDETTFLDKISPWLVNPQCPGPETKKYANARIFNRLIAEIGDEDPVDYEKLAKGEGGYTKKPSQRAVSTWCSVSGESHDGVKFVVVFCNTRASAVCGVSAYAMYAEK